MTHVCLKLPDIIKLYEKLLISSIKCRVFMVNTRQFSGSTYMQDMTKSHTFSAKNQGSTYTPIRLIRREIRYKLRQVRYYKLRRIFITNCDRYYNLRQPLLQLQIATCITNCDVITNCDSTFVTTNNPPPPPPPFPNPQKSS